MKGPGSMRIVKCLLSICLLLVLVSNSSAQIIDPNGNLMPVVTIRASDPLATWSGDPGSFTFFRDGPTNDTLNVYYVIGGTATNGTDYEIIGNWVTIPAGTRTNTVVIKPIDTGQTNIEFVVLKLSPPPNRGSREIGPSSRSPARRR